MHAFSVSISLILKISVMSLKISEEALIYQDGRKLLAKFADGVRVWWSVETGRRDLIVNLQPSLELSKRLIQRNLGHCGGDANWGLASFFKVPEP